MIRAGLGSKAGRLGWLVGLAFLVAVPSAAAATVTSPTNGQTVTLDKDLNFSFAWTMPQGETYPGLYVGDQPSFDSQNSFAPFDLWCGGTTELLYSCTTADSGPLTAGVHYAVLGSASPNDTGNGPDVVSPEIQFTVPARVGLGCFPGVGCGWPKFDNQWAPFGSDVYPAANTQFNLWGWTNGAKLTMAYKIKRGQQVLKQGRHTMTMVNSDPVPATQYPDHLALTIYGFRGVPTGTPLHLTVTLTSGTASLTKTYTVHAGAGPRHGATATYGGS